MSANPAQYTELDAAMEQLAIAEKRARDAERKLHRLEQQMASVSEDSPEAARGQAAARALVAGGHGLAKGVAHGLDSTRAPKVRAALKRRKRISKTEGFEMCRKAILGAKEDDWAMGRVAKSGGRKFNDIAEHILNTDGDIEKFAALFDKRGEKHKQVGRGQRPPAVP
jgi:hypothetical protein